MATATRLQNVPRGWYTKAQRSAGGWAVRDYYLVDSGDPADWDGATNLPEPGDAHDAFTSALCTQVGPPEALTLGDPSDGSGGWVVFPVDYAEPSLSELPPSDTAEDGDAYQLWQSSIQQVTIRRDQAGVRIEPTAIETSAVEIGVVAYMTGVKWATRRANLMAALLPVPTVNTNTVTIPALLNGGALTAFDATAGQLLLRPPRNVRGVQEGGLVEVTYAFGFGPDGTWEHTQRQQDSEGEFTGSPTTHQVYRSGAIPTLWG